MASIPPEEIEDLKADESQEVLDYMPLLPVVILTSRNKTKWRKEALTTVGHQALIISRWHKNLQGFFFSELPKDVSGTL